MMRVVLRSALSCLGLLVMPAVASAQGYIAPYAGVGFGGTIDAAQEEKPYVYGVALGVGGGLLGFELDVAFAPDFFGDSDETFLGGNSVTTAMGNIVVGMPGSRRSGAGVRPYTSAGLGLIRQRIEGFGDLLEFSRNNFGYNFGAGLMVFFSGSVGIRGDVRYFRSFQDSEEGFLSLEAGQLEFSRATAALVFRF